MLPQDTIIEIFLSSPTEELLSIIDDKELALSLLRKIGNSTAMYFLWQRDYSVISTLELIRLAIREDNADVYNKIKGNVTKFFKHSNAKLAGLHNSKKIVENMCKDSYVLDHIAHGAAQGGNTDIIDDMISKDFFHWTSLAHGYARGGHTELLYSVVDLCKYIGLSWYKVGEEAAKGGHRELVYEIINSKGFNRYWLAEAAAFGGDKVLLNDIISKGVRHFNLIASQAAKGGHREIVNDLIHRCSDYNLIAASAARYGHNKIVNDMIKLGTNDYNNIAFEAAKGGNKEIVYKMIEGFKGKDANCFSLIAWVAKIVGCKDLYDDMKYRSTAVLSYNTKLDIQMNW